MCGRTRSRLGNLRLYIHKWMLGCVFVLNMRREKADVWSINMNQGPAKKETRIESDEETSK